MHQRPEQNEWGDHWANQCWISLVTGEQNWWWAKWALVPELIQIGEEDAIGHLLDFAKVVVDNYGFVFWMHRDRGAFGKRYGLPPIEDPTAKAGTELHGPWPARPDHRLLFDVWPINLLSLPYLHQRVGDQPLERWIRSNSARGCLSSSHDEVFIWRVQPEHIPQVREELFRAGLLYYAGFYYDLDHDPLGRFPREFSVPWQPPSDREVPDIFRAEFYKGRDPKITR